MDGWRGREGGWEGGRVGGREGGREGEREGERLRWDIQGFIQMGP